MTSKGENVNMLSKSAVCLLSSRERISNIKK